MYLVSYELTWREHQNLRYKEHILKLSRTIQKSANQLHEKLLMEIVRCMLCRLLQDGFEQFLIQMKLTIDLVIKVHKWSQRGAGKSKMFSLVK